MKIPVIKFDQARVTPHVVSEINNRVRFLTIQPQHVSVVTEAALQSVTRGRDLRVLTDALLGAGFPKKVASEEALFLNNMATSVMQAAHQSELGLQAVWLYSGAPCVPRTSEPTETDLEQDKAHALASGRIYDPATGLHLSGRWTWPGREPGCRCVSKTQVPGF